MAQLRRIVQMLMSVMKELMSATRKILSVKTMMEIIDAHVIVDFAL